MPVVSAVTGVQLSTALPFEVDGGGLLPADSGPTVGEVSLLLPAHPTMPNAVTTVASATGIVRSTAESQVMLLAFAVACTHTLVQNNPSCMDSGAPGGLSSPAGVPPAATRRPPGR